MNETTKQLAPAVESVLSMEKKFTDISKIAGSVNWESEQLFAMQALKKNDYIWGIANSNPESVRNAIVNIAAIGLSLNPATGYAFLVPRDKAIILDISYKGLIKLATDTGAIRWAKANMVCENDQYEYRGICDKPLHTFGNGNSFVGERGKVVGGYCIAKTSDGDFLVEQMTIEQLLKIRDSSPAWVAYKQGKAKQCPWVDFEEEMQKKAIIKRASKTWVKSLRSERFQTALAVINEHDGIDIDALNAGYTPQVEKQVVVISETQEADLIAMLDEKGIASSRLMNYYKIETLSELPLSKYDEAISFLEKAK